jgi:uncharacterized protein (TIGR00255 family)
MIRGMTGFGSAQLSSGGIKGIVEIKSLNHRYFDISYYLPIGFGSIESKIRQMIQSDIERGRVTISIKITEKPHQSVALNKEAVQQHLKFVNMLKRQFKLKNNLTVSDLIALPGVLETKEVLVNPEEIWPGLEKALKKSIHALMVMRRSEGRSLAADVSDKLKRMQVQLKNIKARANAVLQEKKKILTDDEFSSFQRSNDVNEELSRSSHYIAEMKMLMHSAVSVGKKMDFIAQEMQRETNTIGSKLQDKIVSNAVIALKSKIEKIREQSQNIE